MPDFLLMLGREPGISAGLTDLLVRPYGAAAPARHAVSHPWGEVAVLEDGISAGKNIFQVDGHLMAWVGDMVWRGGLVEMRKSWDAFRAACARGATLTQVVEALRGSGLLESLNGAYGLVLAGTGYALVATDPMGSVQVYLGRDRRGQLAAVGTLPDLVARLAGEDYDIDSTSVFDFMNYGIACCPHTMYRNVEEQRPGTVQVLRFGEAGGAPERTEFAYWKPPEELKGRIDERELREEFVRLFRSAVVDRCGDGKVAVQLSGGLDSRAVMAGVPADRECVGATLCDTMNREARIAKQVAACYGREWVTLQRDEEYLGRTVEPATRFTGCEGEWHHGHSILFAGQFREMGVRTVLTGLLMDNNFKGYYAKDVVRVPRLGNLLPATYEVRSRDYLDTVEPFCGRVLLPAVREGARARRGSFVEGHFARGRESAWEWLDGYPYSQACDNTGWVIERRVMPLRIPVMDRRLLDLAFRVPIRLKAGGVFFEQAVAPFLGPGRKIPNANNGVLPGSGHTVRLAHRAMRKIENTRRRMLQRLGVRLEVPHSWHDFHHYWIESPVVQGLREAHGKNLARLHGSAFAEDPVALLHRKDIPWLMGYRLLQLAVWLSLIEEYRR